jgi:hypothetical protein
MWDFLAFNSRGDPDMKRKRYSEEKIISILKEHEAGAAAADLARRHGIAENSIYRWKAKYGGMQVPDKLQIFLICLRELPIRVPLIDSVAARYIFNRVGEGHVIFSVIPKLKFDPPIQGKKIVFAILSGGFKRWPHLFGQLNPIP